MIFETERLRVRKLHLNDLQPYFEMHNNPLVMQYVTGNVETFAEASKSLQEVIAKYDLPNNDFWIYAVERKTDNEFVGTVAFVKEGKDDEIGYRFLEKYWGNGYGFEVCKGMILYAKMIGMPKLIGNVVDVNVASAKILEKLNFKFVSTFVSDDIKLPETKYELKL